jgi:hypothetical protein
MVIRKRIYHELHSLDPCLSVSRIQIATLQSSLEMIELSCPTKSMLGPQYGNVRQCTLLVPVILWRRTHR